MVGAWSPALRVWDTHGAHNEAQRFRFFSYCAASHTGNSFSYPKMFVDEFSEINPRSFLPTTGQRHRINITSACPSGTEAMTKSTQESVELEIYTPVEVAHASAAEPLATPPTTIRRRIKPSRPISVCELELVHHADLEHERNVVAIIRTLRPCAPTGASALLICTGPPAFCRILPVCIGNEAADPPAQWRLACQAWRASRPL